MTALRVTPPSCLAICEADRPSLQSLERGETRSSDQWASDMGGSSRRARIERTRPAPSSASRPANGLHHAQSPQARHLVAADHEMIVHDEPQRPRRLDDFLGYVDLR